MREILFNKAKRIDNGEWVKGYLFRISEHHPPFIMLSDRYGESHEVDPSTICRCTGLKDKNGKLIWENDVVKGAWFDKGKRHRHIGTVSYICCAYKVVGVKQYYGLHDELNGSYTVIGNIFDNPELLKGGVEE